MQSVDTTFLLSEQPFVRENCGPVGPRFLTLIEPEGPVPLPPANRKSNAVYLLEDRDTFRSLPRDLRFFGPALDYTFRNDLRAALVVLFDPEGGGRIGGDFRGEAHEQCAADLLATWGAVAAIKTTPDRLTFWAEVIEMLAPRECRLTFTCWTGAARISHRVAS